MTQDQPKAPDHAFSFGRIHCAIWEEEIERDGNLYTDYSVKMEKRIKDPDSSEYRSTPYHDGKDLFDLEGAIHEARRIMRLRDRVVSRMAG